MSFDDLPIICCRPTPSDAELEAERDRKHDVEVAQYGQGCGCVGECYGYCDWPVTEVIG